MWALWVWRLAEFAIGLTDHDATGLDNMLKVDHFGDAVLDDSAVSLSLCFDADISGNNVNNLSDDDADVLVSLREDDGADDGVVFVAHWCAVQGAASEIDQR